MSSEESLEVNNTDPEYVKQLFDGYATTYDKHGKKLLYAAPRVIRSEMASIYKKRYDDVVRAQGAAAPPTYLSYIQKSLDILDLGCGTGLAGAWLEDYAKSMIGVDLSPGMVEKAKKKVIYSDVRVEDINQYMERIITAGVGSAASGRTTFDLIVAADVLSYIGDLRRTVAQVRPLQLLV